MRKCNVKFNQKRYSSRKRFVRYHDKERNQLVVYTRDTVAQCHSIVNDRGSQLMGNTVLQRMLLRFDSEFFGTV